MKTQNQTESTLTGSAPLKTGKYLKGTDGNLIVNLLNVCFLMHPLGHYVPWKPTLHHGKLMPPQEWERLRNQIGESKKLENPHQLKKAHKIVEELRKNRYYKMTPEQIAFAEKNWEIFLAAKTEGCSVDEYLKREEIRESRRQKKEAKGEKEQTKPKTPEVKTTVIEGATCFKLGSMPALQELLKKVI